MSEFLEALLLAFDVKDASAVYRVVVPVAPVALWFLLTSALALVGLNTDSAVLHSALSDC